MFGSLRLSKTMVLVPVNVAVALPGFCVQFHDRHVYGHGHEYG